MIGGVASGGGLDLCPALLVECLGTIVCNPCAAVAVSLSGESHPAAPQLWHVRQQALSLHSWVRLFRHLH